MKAPPVRTFCLGSKNMNGDRPSSIRPVPLPRRTAGFPSPADWRDEIIYFLLPDRFSDGKEGNRPMLQVGNRAAARPDGFRFDRWAQSGGSRYQGGTIAGITSKLGYLAGLGVTTIWVGPVFRNRARRDDYHGYAIQDFLDVEPRLGTRQDLIDLVAAAHAQQLRVILDVVFNHTGNNWIYANGQDQPPFLPFPRFYQKGPWRDASDNPVSSIGGRDDGVWPTELQRDDYYTRAGEGDLGAGDIDDPHAEFRRTDFIGDRDVNYDGTTALDDVARCYKYWIAQTDCDGFRIDTLKHVDQATGRNFCGTIREFAANLGKKNFFLVAEVAGADRDADRYLQVLGTNLSATLDIGEIRPTLTAVAKGLREPQAYFDIVATWDDDLGSHRDAGLHRVSILDDHDHVSGAKVRFSADAQPAAHQVVAGVAMQLFGVGIPCIYYGTEQALAGPEKSLRDQFLPDWGSTDKYLREAMFGPASPLASGRVGAGPAGPGADKSLPGFGPFGTSGAHCFNPASPAYVRIAALIQARRAFPVLRYGRQYQRQLWNGADFTFPAGGQLIVWSRILDDEEALCVVNGNGGAARGGDVLVDANLNAAAAAGRPWGAGGPAFTVVANSAQAAAGAAYAGSHPVGESVPVAVRDGTTFVHIRDLQPSEVLVLINR
jgi:glycosidase